MKTSELMINDWVIAYGKNTQVVWVGNLQKLAVRGFPSEFFEDEIEPIPLTPEILEKNGFTEIKGTNTTFKIDIYGYLIKVTFPKENEETNKRNPFLVIDSRPSYYSSECLYVHELQHVLRLLGIEKEIEL